MSKKTWSIVLLGILAVLFIVLCVMGVKMKESLAALEHAEPTDGVIPGAGILTFIYAKLSYLGFFVITIALSSIGIWISCLNISIAHNKVIKFFSLGFLNLYFISAVWAIVMTIGDIIQIGKSF